MPEEGPRPAPSAAEPPGSSQAPAPGEIPALLAQLASQALGFLEARLDLAEHEWRNEVRRVRLLAWRIAIGLAALFVGLQLLTAGAILLVGGYTGRHWLLVLVAGALYAAAGGVLVWRRRRDLGRPHRIFDKTFGELEKDRRWVAGKG